MRNSFQTAAREREFYFKHFKPFVNIRMHAPLSPTYLSAFLTLVFVKEDKDHVGPLDLPLEVAGGQQHHVLVEHVGVADLGYTELQTEVREYLTIMEKATTSCARFHI